MTIGLALLVVVIGAEVLAKLIATYQRSPWCWCGHPRGFHDHDRPGNDCSRCECPRFGAPIVRRGLAA